MDEGQRELRLLVHHLHWLSVILKYEKKKKHVKHHQLKSYFVTSVLVQPEIGVECIQKCMRATAVRSEPARGEKVKF